MCIFTSQLSYTCVQVFIIKADLDLLLCILQYPEPHFLIEKVVDFAAVDLKEASTDSEVFLAVLWQGIQFEHI